MKNGMDVLQGQRLSFGIAKCEDENENSLKFLLKKHYLNHAVSIAIPGESSIPKDVLQTIECSTYFVVKNLSLEDVTDYAFIEAFVRRGSLTMMSCNKRIDTDFCFCILPDGMLIMNLPKEEYESFGLEGKCSNYFLNNQFKYIIQLDLKDTDLSYSSKKYSRISKVISNIRKRFDVMVSWTPPDESISVESIFCYFTQRNRSCINGKLLRSSSLMQDFKTPILNPEKPDLCLEGSGPEGFYEWLGAVSCGCSFGSSDAYDNTFVHPEDCLPPTECALYMLRGFIPLTAIEQLISKLRIWSSTVSGKVPWVSVTVHGFMDAPVSWNLAEHGFDICGDNNHSIIIFPGSGLAWSFVTHHSRENVF